MRRSATALAALSCLALALSACRSAPSAAVGPQAPLPRIDLAGQTALHQAQGPYDVPMGPGAEGRAGDWVIEDAFVRFVVAGLQAPRASGQAGNLIDAAMQGGEDRMRLLVPLLGSRPRLEPAYTNVRAGEPGGKGAPASLVVVGHLPGQPKITVTTTYSLKPDDRMLEVVTSVRNDSDAVLPGFGLADRLYQGRAERFVPGAGLWPAGRTSSAHWEAFFGGGYVWGLIGPVLSPTQGVHEAGFSTLTYSTTDLGPGQVREFKRYVLAEFGGPEMVWLGADPVPETQLCTLSVEVRDDTSGGPVAGGYVYVQPAAGRPAFVTPLSAGGAAEMKLPKGRYEVHVESPGRPPSTVHTVDIAAGARAQWKLTLSPPAAVALSVRCKIEGVVAPLTGRVTAFSLEAAAPQEGTGPPYPMEPPVSAVLIPAGRTAALPLAPAGPNVPGRYLLSASRGPLFDYAEARLSASVGGRPELTALLDRVADPGEYVAVDMCQHTDASPDCALTVPERVLSDACEGLQAAVAVDPALPAEAPMPPPESECVLLNGLRLDRSGQGDFSVYPIRAADAGNLAPGEPSDGPMALSEVEGLTDPGLSAADVLGRAAKRFPDALVQVNDPLDPDTGYFVLGRFDRSTGKSALAGFEGDFDALELLSGNDVQGARDLLPYWFGLLNAGKQVLVTGGSGSVGVSGAQAPLARTFVYCRDAGPMPTAAQVADAVRALKKAPNAFVTNCPFIVATLNGRPIGSRQTVKDGKADLHLRVFAPNWADVQRVRIFRNGEAVVDVTAPMSATPLRYERTFTLDAPAPCWFVVVVEGRRPLTPAYYAGKDTPTPFAATNPWWVDKAKD